MDHLVAQRASAVLNVPLSLPQTLLQGYDTVTVATIKLALGQRLVISHATLQLLQAKITGPPVKIQCSLGYCYLGVYGQGFEAIHIPTGSPTKQLVLQGPGSKAWNPYDHREFHLPGTYEIVVSNNLQNADLDVVMTGSARLYLN